MRLLLLLTACEPELAPLEVSDVSAVLVEGSESVITVSWAQNQAAAAHISYRTDGGPWLQTPTRDTGPGEASLYILGVPYDTAVEWELHVSGDGGNFSGDTQVTTTGPLPDGLPLPTVLVDDGGWDESAPYLLNSTHEGEVDWSTPWWVFIMNRDGEVVWARRSSPPAAGPEWLSRHVTLTHDGDAMLVDRATAWSEFDDGAASTVVEMTLDGTVQHTYQTPGLHHPFTGLPGGRLAWAARDLVLNIRETIEVVDREGAQQTIWGCDNDILPESCGSNTLWWDARTDRFLYSLWSTETVMDIDAQSGDVLRTFGLGVASWRFDPPESAFVWQHGPLYTEAGTLLVSTKARGLDGEPTTVAREYRLDEERETLVEIWSAGADVYGEFGGDVRRLPGGNTLHGYGTGSHLVEYSPDGEIVWQASWDGFRRIGQTTPLADLYALLP